MEWNAFQFLHREPSGIDRAGTVVSGPQKAFTLAEVLITLAIIGVVAALTIPTVVRNYQKQQTITALKKAYSVINQALQMSQVENGHYSTWDYSLDDTAFAEKYLTNYFSISKNCKKDSYKTCLNPNYNILTLNGKSFSGGLILLYSYKFVTKDGQIFFIGTNSLRANIAVDINGIQKPNVLGKDVFSFWLLPPKAGITNSGNGDVAYDVPKWGLYPDGYGIFYTNGWRHCTKTDTSVQLAGFHCSAKIIKDGWQIKDNYPW